MCIPLALLGSDSVKRYRGNEYTHNNRRTIGCVVFFAVRDMSKQSKLLDLTSFYFYNVLKFYNYILTILSVTIDGVWIGNWIY
jgi:hypothetical protein